MKATGFLPNKRVRKRMAPDAGVFQVYSVLIGSGGNGDDRAGVDAGTEEMRSTTTGRNLPE